MGFNTFGENNGAGASNSRFFKSFQNFFNLGMSTKMIADWIGKGSVLIL